ncbi:hypothetical protein D9756_005549 [Leucocoprinus leucothites]|uniref:Uncharacterized protein n=1 Tax=Leucocoprinus leucothites TaxID=201217 RepID=A0A8H5D6Y9_9AGAR|nr:hypothetical protein D9756_005549 [Leucoagaricus leucothites]
MNILHCSPILHWLQPPPRKCQPVQGLVLRTTVPTLQSHVEIVVGATTEVRAPVHAETNLKIGAAETRDGTGQKNTQGQGRGLGIDRSPTDDHPPALAGDTTLGPVHAREIEKRNGKEDGLAQSLRVATNLKTVGNAGNGRRKVDGKRVESEGRRKREKRKKRRHVAISIAYTMDLEERKINPETLLKDQERKEFARYIEDFNTGTYNPTYHNYKVTNTFSATLPHEKFYDMAKYERRMDALRQGEYLPPAEDTYDPAADMRALTGAHKRKAPERESYMSREQLEELRKVQNERVQVSKMKLLGMDVKQTMGVRMDGTAFDDI